MAKELNSCNKIKVVLTITKNNMRKIKNFLWRYKIAITACVLMATLSVAFWIVAQSTITTVGENVDVGGVLKVGGNIVDSANNVIYDNTTGKISAEKLPFDQGDIVSDWETNEWDLGFYDVASLNENTILAGTAFGRGQTGERLLGPSTVSYGGASCGFGTNCTNYGSLGCTHKGGTQYYHRVTTYTNFVSNCYQSVCIYSGPSGCITCSYYNVNCTFN
jgi:hypothetical protein